MPTTSRTSSGHNDLPQDWREKNEQGEAGRSKYGGLVDLILKAVALGMAVASIVLGVLKVATVETHVTLLGIGLFALALAALQKADETVE